MTKIAISPNVNGTGTFTLAAPNSNTDRTLTLPDAAGEVFNQGNILGTVSQSAGVPTGGIIQRGSNANGEFVRFADGTQICQRIIANFTVTEGFNNFRIPTPAAFVGSLTFSGISVVGSVSAESRDILKITVGVISSQWDLRATEDVSFQNRDIAIIAIGRWF